VTFDGAFLKLDQVLDEAQRFIDEALTHHNHSVIDCCGDDHEVWQFKDCSHIKASIFKMLHDFVLVLNYFFLRVDQDYICLTKLKLSDNRGKPRLVILSH